MSDVTEAFVDRLVATHPELTELRRQHLEDNFGEMLPHLWTSDLVRFLVARYEAEGVDAVGPVLATLDAEAGRDPEIDELLGVSFVEVLPHPGETGAGLVENLGPHLTGMLHEQRP